MAKFYVAFSSMEKMIKLTETTSMGEIITLISEMEEFESFRCRTGKFRAACAHRYRRADAKLWSRAQEAFGDVQQKRRRQVQDRSQVRDRRVDHGSQG